MAMTDLTIVRRSLMIRRLSTLTTVATVGVAVALMLVLLAMRESGRRALERGSGNVHLLLSRDASPLVSVLNGLFYANAPPRAIDWPEYAALLTRAGGRTPPIVAQLEWSLPMLLGDSYRGYPVVATTEQYLERFEPVPGRPWRLARGRWFRWSLEAQTTLEGLSPVLHWSPQDASFEVVLGATVARRTGLAPGDKIVLRHGLRAPAEVRAPAADPDDEHDDNLHHAFPFTIVGVLEPSGTVHDRALFTDLASSWVLHAAEFHERSARTDLSLDGFVREAYVPPITGALLRVRSRPGAATASALPALHDALRREAAFTVASPADQIRQLLRIVAHVDQILLAMAAVVMVASSIAILLALYNSMDQRRRQVAILRVLGCSRGRVFGLVITESAVLGLLGAAVGVAISLAGASLVARIMYHRVGLTLEPHWSPELIMLMVLAAVGLASAAGLVPAAMAYRTPVARHLRPVT